MSVRRQNSNDALFPRWKELLRRAADRLKIKNEEEHARLVDSLIKVARKERQQTAKKLRLVTLSVGGDPSERLADYLTKRRDYRDSWGDLLIVFVLHSAKQKMYDDARRISEIMDWMPPLCLPQNLVIAAWLQFTDKESVASQRRWREGCSPSWLWLGFTGSLPISSMRTRVEPRGKRLAAFSKDLAIDDSNAGEAKLVHEISTSPPITPKSRKPIVAELRDHGAHVRGGDKEQTKRTV